KLTDSEIISVENQINDWIEDGYQISREEMNIAEAKNSGATGIFADKYGESVTVYTISKGDIIISKEICKGPHVKQTSELRKFKIIKEEASSGGIRRIRAVLE
ncbi:MAG: alanyl-tRNA synthetase, partial [Candidatus Berkelbacteria bacterium Licking1014_85]